ncbi:MAG: Flagellar L-ring protein [Alphaproteobacteria bacterium MarineAlpha9_Bin4]|nr:flagellar biosynthesis protein FlgH [Pelagibacterales bacterium]PPR25812.1 MAG: Flagellar L-ring protein [Alphaproteobacteria bacterium MarineAlpha9_Bin4]|tara:strand:+ start:1277 stop:1999 length:723 start_codon:yes stop_codon:yes gene_type:complete
MKISIFILSISFFLAGCSTYVENKKAEEFIPIHQEISFSEEDNTIDGSIYNQKSSGFFASDRRAKNVGDILTITLNESLSASKSTTNTTSKADTFGVTLPPLFSNGAATKSVANQLDNKLGLGNGGVESSDFAAGANQSFSGAGTAAQSNTLSGSMTVTVVRVYPNGNLEIKGQKKLVLNDGSEYLRLSGIIRPEDISANNTISSSNIADAKITYTNSGVYATSTKPGWLSKIFRDITPF